MYLIDVNNIAIIPHASLIKAKTIIHPRAQGAYYQNFRIPREIKKNLP
jgi:hypothetical protein